MFTKMQFRYVGIYNNENRRDDVGSFLVVVLSKSASFLILEKGNEID